MGLLDDLRALLVEQDDAKRAEFDRSLPFAELVGDRWERARRLGFGEGATVYDAALVFGDVTVGEGTWVGPFTVLDGSGGPLKVGAWCSIAAGVHLYTHDTVRWALSGGTAERVEGAVTVGDRCYIGPQSVVRAGVTIGAMCVVGAGSYVNRDIPDRTVVAGSPARPVGRVEGAGNSVRIHHAYP